MKRRPHKTYTIVWRDITCRVRHTPGYFEWADHVELEVLAPKGAILPITDTGYRSHFPTPEEVAAAGGPVALVLKLIQDAETSKVWKAREVKSRQLSLFD